MDNFDMLITFYNNTRNHNNLCLFKYKLVFFLEFRIENFEIHLNLASPYGAGGYSIPKAPSYVPPPSLPAIPAMPAMPSYAAPPQYPQAPSGCNPCDSKVL